MQNAQPQRRLPIGAEVQPAGTHFRVYAGPHRAVSVVVYDAGLSPRLEQPLHAEGDGYFSGLCPEVGAGALYHLRLDQIEAPLPDPASRYQPRGPRGPSEVIDPQSYRWSDAGWAGVPAGGLIAYELHVGTFTAAGTFSGAARELPYLRDTGVTLIELMPVADFPGQFGWGYDGVNLFAPSRLYGAPDDLRRFVDRAHGLGLSVILDVVYNHLGPMDNTLGLFSPTYFTDRYRTDWGAALNFDGADAGPTRALYCANAAYWIDEFHLDGLRLDATQNIYDRAPPTAGFGAHILAEIGQAARRAAGSRRVFLVAENEPQHTRLVRPLSQGGHGLDALWNDDFHHTARVALTGHAEAYYSDYRGTPQELLSCAKWGYLYQGQRYAWQAQRRGTPGLDLAPGRFVCFLENHDQVANSGYGARCHQLTSPGRLRALTALLLLGPWVPMLFQGQEYGTTRPFLYFADHQDGIREAVFAGRRASLSQFRSLATVGMQARVPEPGDPRTFQRCVLDSTERAQQPALYALHRDLCWLRRDDAVLGAARAGAVDGAVLGPQAFVLRFFAPEPTADRLLLCNLGADLHLSPAPEPLLAPPWQRRWAVAWSSEDPRYGGGGVTEVETDAGFLLPGESAVLLRPAPRERHRGGGAPAELPTGAAQDPLDPPWPDEDALAALGGDLRWTRA